MSTHRPTPDADLHTIVCCDGCGLPIPGVLAGCTWPQLLTNTCILLARAGWLITDDHQLCPDCAAESRATA